MSVELRKPKGGGAPPPITNRAEDLIAKMREGINTTFEVQSRALVVPMRVLSLEEVNLIRRTSIAEAAKVQGDQIDRDVEMQKATLKLASNIDGAGPILNDRFFKFASVDEVDMLFTEYITKVDAINPSLETIPEAEFQRLVDAIKKNTITSKDLNLRQLRAIFTDYQEKIQRQAFHESRPANSSGGFSTE